MNEKATESETVICNGYYCQGIAEWDVDDICEKCGMCVWMASS